MKPIDKSPGWEARLFRKIAGPDTEKYLAKRRIVNEEMVERAKLWTPEGEVDPWSQTQMWSLSTDSGFNGFLEWTTSQDTPTWGGISPSIPASLPIPTTTVFKHRSAGMTSYANIINSPWWSTYFHPSPAAGFQITNIEAPEPDPEEDRKRREAELAAARKKLEFQESVLAASDWPVVEQNTKKMPKASPDYTECLTGWRTWEVEYDRLCATGIEYSWHPGEAVPAECRCSYRFDRHDAPQRGCDCGYYSFKTQVLMAGAIPDIHELFESGGDPLMTIAFGPVYVWGRVVECENGWRSEYAYPKEIYSFNPEHAALGAVYGVPVRIPRCDLTVRPTTALKKG